MPWPVAAGTGCRHERRRGGASVRPLSVTGGCGMSESVASYYWRGNGPLWKVYWLYGVLGSNVLRPDPASADAEERARQRLVSARACCCSRPTRSGSWSRYGAARSTSRIPCTGTWRGRSRWRGRSMPSWCWVFWSSSSCRPPPRVVRRNRADAVRPIHPRRKISRRYSLPHE